MISRYKEYYWKDDAHLLELHNCRNCDIQILVTEKLCDTCRVLLVSQEDYEYQKDMWKRYIYIPWLRSQKAKGLI